MPMSLKFGTPSIIHSHSGVVCSPRELKTGGCVQSKRMGDEELSTVDVGSAVGEVICCVVKNLSGPGRSYGYTMT